jgi:hypothetical protein
MNFKSLFFNLGETIFFIIIGYTLAWLFNPLHAISYVSGNLIVYEGTYFYNGISYSFSYKMNPNTNFCIVEIDNKTYIPNINNPEGIALKIEYLTNKSPLCANV